VLACGSTVTPLGSANLPETAEGGFALSAPSVLRTHELGMSDTFSVALTVRPEADVTLRLALSDETEGTLSKTALTFTPDDWETRRMVRVTGAAEAGLDGDVEYDVEFVVESDAPGYRDLELESLPALNEDFVIERVSVPADAFDASGTRGSGQTALSDGGREVVFETFASLTSDDTNHDVQDVYVHDRDTGTTRLLSAYDGGVWDTDAHDSIAARDPAITPDGRHVSFISPAPLTAEEEHSDEWTFDIYISDLQSPELALERVTSEDHSPRQTALSADGRFIAFGGNPDSLQSETPHAPLRYDRSTGEIDDGLSNAPTDYEPVNTTALAISADGKTILFTYVSRQLLPGAGGSPPTPVPHVHTAVVTLDADGGATNAGQKFWPSTPLDVESRNALSHDGQVLAFSLSGEIVVVGANREHVRLIGKGQWTSLSADGRYLAFQSDADFLNTRPDGAPELQQVYVVDLHEEKIASACLDELGNAIHTRCVFPTMASDGTAVSFSAASDRLVGGDDNGITDAFVVELDEGFWNTATNFALQPVIATAAGRTALDEDLNPGDQVPR